jgi:hypothetical protein
MRFFPIKPQMTKEELKKSSTTAKLGRDCAALGFAIRRVFRPSP